MYTFYDFLHSIQHIYFVEPARAIKHFVAIYFVFRLYFSYFDQTITVILSIFTKVTYLWHTREATAISGTKHIKFDRL